MHFTTNTSGSSRVITYFPSGRIQEVTAYSNDTISDTLYYENGKPARIENNKGLSGERNLYYPNGKIKSVTISRPGYALREEYDEEGNLLSRQEN